MDNNITWEETRNTVQPLPKGWTILVTTQYIKLSEIIFQELGQPAYINLGTVPVCNITIRSSPANGRKVSQPGNRIHCGRFITEQAVPAGLYHGEFEDGVLLVDIEPEGKL